MVVTIYTDAAFSEDWRRAGFAYWITLPFIILKQFGPVEQEVDNPTIAEIKAIQNALLFMLDNTNFSFVKSIILYTDSRAAINILANEVEYIKKYRLDRPAFKKAGNEFKKLVANQLQSRDINISWRHVKAHEDTDTNRRFINDWCDLAAKLELTKLIRTLKKPTAERL